MDKRGEMQPGGKPPAENGDGPVKRRFRWTVGRIIALSLAGVAVAALAFAGLHYYHLMRNPGAAFQTRPVASGTPAGIGYGSDYCRHSCGDAQPDANA